MLITPNDYDYTLDLVLKKRAPGKVRISLFDSRGARVSWPPDLTIRLIGSQNVFTEKKLADDWDPKTGDLVFTSPAGCYELVLDPELSGFCLSIESCEVCISPGELSHAPMRVILGGKLRLIFPPDFEYTRITASGQTIEGALSPLLPAREYEVRVYNRDQLVFEKKVLLAPGRITELLIKR